VRGISWLVKDTILDIPPIGEPIRTTLAMDELSVIRQERKVMEGT